MSPGGHAVVVGSDGLLVDVVFETGGLDSLNLDRAGDLDLSSRNTRSQGSELEVGLNSV